MSFVRHGAGVSEVARVEICGEVLRVFFGGMRLRLVLSQLRVWVEIGELSGIRVSS